MNHTECRNKLFDYHDGLLGEDDRAQLEAHLKVCPDCYARLDNWRRFAELVSATETVLPDSEAFVSQVMNRIEALDQNPRRVRVPVQWFAPAIGMAAMLVLALLPAQGGFAPEMLLWNARPGDPMNWVLSTETPQKDDVLNFVMEVS